MTAGAYSVLIISLWVFIWLIFYFYGPRQQQLPTHPILRRYSIALFIFIGLFYAMLYSTTDLVQIPPITWPGHTIVTITLLLSGTLLLVRARRDLPRLSYLDLIVALNPNTERSGMYTYFAHPMYIGIIAILTGSLLAIPNTLAILLLLPISFCIRQKLHVEHRHHNMYTKI